MKKQITGREDDKVCVYHVDRTNHIVRVNAAWGKFAQENQATELNPGMIEGASIWRFISDLETRHLFELILAKARQGLGPIRVPFRCDAPSQRRFMEMTVDADEDGNVEVTSRVLRQEHRAPVRLLEEGVDRSDEVLASCSWCKRVELPEGEWVEVEQAVAVLELFSLQRLPRISHGICRECTKKIEGVL